MTGAHRAVLAVALFGVTIDAVEQPTTPTLCTSSNMGRCECANLQTTGLAKGNTYTWWIDGTQRCLTTYVPSSSDVSNTSTTGSIRRPTVLFLQCYGKD
eukprot:gene14573-106_t